MFLSLLARQAIIEPCDPAATRARAGIFFVKRKDEYIHLIFDPRDGNSRCAVPPKTKLPSAGGLSGLEVDEGCRGHLRAGDADCCFYQYEAPLWARALFVLDSVDVRYLDPDIRDLFGDVSQGALLGPGDPDGLEL